MLSTKKIIGEIIKRQRLKSGLTLNELAAKLNVDRQYIWKLERGQVNMSLDYVDKVLKILNCSPVDFFNKSNVKFDK